MVFCAIYLKPLDQTGSPPVIPLRQCTSGWSLLSPKTNQKQTWPSIFQKVEMLTFKTTSSQVFSDNQVMCLCCWVFALALKANEGGSWVFVDSWVMRSHADPPFFNDKMLKSSALYNSTANLNITGLFLPKKTQNKTNKYTVYLETVCVVLGNKKGLNYGSSILAFHVSWLPYCQQCHLVQMELKESFTLEGLNFPHSFKWMMPGG